MSLLVFMAIPRMATQRSCNYAINSCLSEVFSLVCPHKLPTVLSQPYSTHRLISSMLTIFKNSSNMQDGHKKDDIA